MFLYHVFIFIFLFLGGHLDVVQLLVSNRADIDSQDNRRVSSLMTAFRKGHIKVVKWLVRHVTQFPSDQECGRYIATVNDKVRIGSLFYSSKQLAKPTACHTLSLTLTLPYLTRS